MPYTIHLIEAQQCIAKVQKLHCHANPNFEQRVQEIEATRAAIEKLKVFCDHLEGGHSERVTS